MICKVTHLLLAFSNGIFLYICAAVDKISIDSASRGAFAIAELLAFVYCDDKEVRIVVIVCCGVLPKCLCRRAENYI